MFQINVGPNRRVHLQFDQDAGFGLEWHRQCGFDKVHIFRGNADNFVETNRIARFCGPKSGSAPFDGSGKLKAVDGSQPMWDTAFNTRSSEILVGIDLDQGTFSELSLKVFTLEFR